MRYYIVARIILFALMNDWLKGGEGKKTEAKEDSFCGPFPGILLEGQKTAIFENGSLVHNKSLYPSDSYRVIGNETYGCVCNVRSCLRKCCGPKEILGAGYRPNCTRLENGTFAPDLLLKKYQLDSEIKEISGLSELFVLVEDMLCPENTSRYILQPELYDEDKFVLQANGNLRTPLDSFSPSNYCLDWKESFDAIVAVVCKATLPSPYQTQQQSYKIGIIVSIPFFLITFLVYAIIPELRNLYGKTLMCYVACLVVAYTFLFLAKRFYFKFALCSTIECVAVTSPMDTSRHIRINPIATIVFSRCRYFVLSYSFLAHL